MVKSLKSEILSLKPSISHGFFLRSGGVSKGAYASLNCGVSSADDPQAVAENRRRVAADMGVDPDKLLSCYQIHSSDAVEVTEAWTNENRPRADALATKELGVALGVLTADCAPVLMVDEQAGVIGAAHAGWRGAVGGVLENAIAAMERLGGRRENIAAAVGPCIWRENYEVGAEFPAQFIAENPANAGFFAPSAREGHHMFDLAGYVEARLRRAGVGAVSPSIADTYSDNERFFSYRRQCLSGESRTGTMLSVVCLVANR